ncbi:hypothetical protein SEA_WOFFORD_266 [Streptomyces phage Wofford]|uniref:Gene product 88 domain-containing protein n=1 Tax=Streptomyces phage Wofford TaxID=2283267 RepID=A0A345M9N5_9CAUD|nr:hypothetical protein HWB78_gp008 [Streptomyces phage Wollford]YP_009839909.1 hypothetical protein HWB78_gp053 [Streptomyces phage Wollford]AXH67206.1 hypothetical protein SEA_WOFFORD_8 [Streptomyces phage Wollford]AXH67400.1 hypothetical protein SEA_WOFFORD_266 [Streptomyces phage Wollford]
MARLKRTNDRKTTARVNANGTQSLLKNAFSLPSGTAYSCPGATKVCETVCYAGKLERQYPAFRNLALHNWELLKDASLSEMMDLLIEMIEEFSEECAKNNISKVFRWHADGDIFSADYAHAIGWIAERFTDVQFWIYTRSFEYVQYIVGIPNLSVYLSVDGENEQKALETKSEYPSVRLAYLSETHETGKEFMLTNTGKPGAICPENAKRIPLITKDGGACVTCGLCIFGKADIRFASKVSKRRAK